MKRSYEISLDEIKFSSLSLVDDIGKVFFWKDRVFRGIRSEAKDDVQCLFDSGLINRLIKQDLIPNTWITDFSLNGYTLVIEHKRIKVVSYPYEWSMEMLRASALRVLEINKIANDYGYELKDCHGYNILFEGTNPLFVDLGSFVPRQPGIQSWIAEEEFLKYYYYPLYLWSIGNTYLARRIMAIDCQLMPHESFLLIKYSWLRFLNINFIRKVVAKYFRFKLASRWSPEEILDKRSPIIASTIIALRRSKILPFQRTELGSLENRIAKFHGPKLRTPWGDYHDDFSLKENNLILSERFQRFERIREVLSQESVHSVVELAGNQGLLSCYLLDCNCIQSAVCSDYDEQAVDVMFRNTQKNNVNLLPVILDFVFPITIFRGTLPAIRFQSDAVIALAVTHHLILTQGIALESVFEILHGYTNRLILIEFMPLGLFDGEKAPELPDWYNVEWFSSTFKKYFVLKLQEQLEENRILFVGQRKET